MSLLSAVAAAVAIVTVIATGVNYCYAEYYNCENGVYETLYQVTEECRQSAPHLRNVRKSFSQVSGQDVVDMFQDYCKMASDVTSCVEGHIDFLPCLKMEKLTFLAMNRRSNWYCDGHRAKSAVTNIYQNLSMESLNYRQNECYREAPVKAYPCMRRYLSVSQSRDRKETMKRILSSVRCTFRKLQKKCGRDSALLLTTLEYDWLLIPPALGINVTDTLVTIAKIKFK